jgi:predicted esterase
VCAPWRENFLCHLEPHRSAAINEHSFSLSTRKGKTMNAKRSLALLVLGIGSTVALLPDSGPAQIPNTALTGQRIDEARIKVLQQLIRQHALSLKPEDLSKLSPSGKPLVPFLPKPGQARGVSVVRPSEKANTAAKGQHPALTSSKEHKASAATRKDGATDSKPVSKETAHFDPYPHGPEPRIPTTPSGYHPSIQVLAPGRLDWTFVVSQQSLDPGPTRATAGYISTLQTYELYLPPSYSPRRPNAMIIHVTAGPRSDGWLHWQTVCRNRGVILAGVHNAGNAVPMPLRARIVLDVLDDVRRRFNIDPDRTYISGMSGGANAASRIAFALPELFGGLIPICGTWNLRVEPMLRQRVSERLSVALVTGTHDFNGPELIREFFPVLQAHNARAQLWVFPMGHAYPGSWQMDGIFQWVEAGLPLRRIAAGYFPASRLVGPASPDQWSTALLLEAGERLELPGELAPGLFQLQGIVERWKGLPAAAAAQKLLNEFDSYSPVPWKDIYRNELLCFRYLQARMFDNTLNSPPPSDYPVPRINLIRIAVALWSEILELAPAGSPIAQEAKARLDIFHKQGG